MQLYFYMIIIISNEISNLYKKIDICKYIQSCWTDKNNSTCKYYISNYELFKIDIF